MDGDDLAKARHEAARAKARVLRRCDWLKTKGTTPAIIGRAVSTHGRPCSCWMCHDKGRKAWRDQRQPTINTED